MTLWQRITEAVREPGAREIREREHRQRLAEAELRTAELQAMIDTDAQPAFLTSSDMQIILKALSDRIRLLERKVKEMNEAHEVNPINPKAMALALRELGKARTLFAHIKEESEARWQTTDSTPTA